MYYEAGLRELAIASGFRAETLKSVANAQNFKRTHAFLMQVWEVFYKHFLEQYLSLRESEAVDEYEEMMTHIRSNLHKCNKECMESHSYDEYIY